mmetsp:Transcript_52733/g.104649  ORF Transcript_52733/g.104649 Transcript_52733/m.104649 type:complete len:384 (-) Transcript_52733:116-1267(-)
MVRLQGAASTFSDSIQGTSRASGSPLGACSKARPSLAPCASPWAPLPRTSQHTSSPSSSPPCLTALSCCRCPFPVHHPRRQRCSRSSKARREGGKLTRSKTVLGSPTRLVVTNRRPERVTRAWSALSSASVTLRAAPCDGTTNRTPPLPLSLPPERLWPKDTPSRRSPSCSTRRGPPSCRRASFWRTLATCSAGSRNSTASPGWPPPTASPRRRGAGQNRSRRRRSSRSTPSAGCSTCSGMRTWQSSWTFSETRRRRQPCSTTRSTATRGAGARRRTRGPWRWRRLLEGRRQEFPNFLSMPPVCRQAPGQKADCQNCHSRRWATEEMQLVATCYMRRRRLSLCPRLRLLRLHLHLLRFFVCRIPKDISPSAAPYVQQAMPATD